MVLAEHELFDEAEGLIEEARKDKANNIPEQEIKKRLSVRLRNLFPEADMHVISGVVNTAIRKSTSVKLKVVQDNEENLMAEEENPEEHKGVIQKAEEIAVNVLHKEPIEEHGLPIIKDVLHRKINLIKAGMQSKALYNGGKLHYDSYQAILHVLHAIGRYFLERPHVEAGIKTLETMASHTQDENNRRFVEEVIKLVKDWDEEKEKEKRRTLGIIKRSAQKNTKEQIAVLGIIKKTTEKHPKQEKERQRKVLDSIKKAARNS